MMEITYCIGNELFLITVEAKPVVNGAPVFVAEAFKLSAGGRGERVMQPDGRIFETLRASESEAADAAARHIATAIGATDYSKGDGLERSDFHLGGGWTLPVTTE